MVVAKGSRLRRAIIDEIEESCYKFKAPNEADEARETLLDLLDWLLKIGHAVRDTKTCRRLIIGILRRKEFSLEHIGFGLKQQQKLPASESSLELLSRYRKSLAHCVLFCGNLVDRKWIKGKIAYKFCNQVLAIAFFRLPIAGLVIKIQQQHQANRLGTNSTRKLSDKDTESQKRIDERYHKYKQICKRMSADHVTCTSFINANPSLYSWNWFTSQWDLKFQEVLARKEKQTSWLSNMLASSEGFPCFLNEYVRHVCLVCDGPVMWTVIPGYQGMIDLFYREFADCGRHLCSSRRSLREWTTSECRVNLETSCQVMVNTRLVNVMILLAYENCNIHSLKDVENTISLIEMWLTVCCDVCLVLLFCLSSLPHLSVSPRLFIFLFIFTSQKPFFIILRCSPQKDKCMTPKLHLNSFKCVKIYEEIVARMTLLRVSRQVLRSHGLKNIIVKTNKTPR